MAEPPTGDQAEEAEKKKGTREKVLEEVTRKLEEATAAQQEAATLNKRCDETDDPEEKGNLRTQAQALDKKAASAMKAAQRLQSGFLQGGASGAGIGAGIAGGLGTVVGSLVGGITAIPTTGLGLLIGAGVGLIHGPWIKLPDGTVKIVEKDEDLVEGEIIEGQDIQSLGPAEGNEHGSLTD